MIEGRVHPAAKMADMAHIVPAPPCCTHFRFLFLRQKGQPRAKEARTSPLCASCIMIANRTRSRNSKGTKESVGVSLLTKKETVQRGIGGRHSHLAPLSPSKLANANVSTKQSSQCASAATHRSARYADTLLRAPTTFARTCLIVQFSRQSNNAVDE